MRELERAIFIYHTAFLICLILGILFLALAIFIFVRYRLRRDAPGLFRIKKEILWTHTEETL